MMPRWRDFQRPGRSEALGADGMVSSPHPQATLAALDVLRAGGNAVDAAVCAAALLGVVDPTQSGVGGDCFILLMPGGTGPVIAMDGSGWAPLAAEAGWYVDRGFTCLPWNTPHAITVPGAVSAWDRVVRDHGRLGLARALQPAIDAAERGFVVTERVAHDWIRKEAKLSGDAEAARIFTPGGRAPRFGAQFRLPELAATLRSIARHGSAGFYGGWVAEDIVGTLQIRGGLHSMDDLACFDAEYVTPIHAAYRDHDLWQCPPAGVGVVALLMAQVLKRFEVPPPGTVEHIHLLGEIGRLAYAARDAVLGDPRTGIVPVDALLSDGFAATLAARVDPGQRLPDLTGLTDVPNHRDTAFVSVVDRDRTMVALIGSNFDDFGSGIAAGRSGVILQNRGCGFVVRPGHPNCVGGRKRPMHTIIPAILSKDGRAVMAFGVTGGQFQPAGQMQVLSHILDQGMGLQQAIEQPRFFAKNGEIELERGFDPAVGDQLRGLGYDVTAAGDPLGTAHAVWIDWANGVLHGAADFRRDGLALGW
jgi:gamma-glutamyltranspeptidase/glutathione hydrolase